MSIFSGLQPRPLLGGIEPTPANYDGNTPNLSSQIAAHVIRDTLKKAIPDVKVQDDFSMSSFARVVRVTYQPKFIQLTVMINEDGSNPPAEQMAEHLRRNMLISVEQDPLVKALIEERGYLTRTEVARIADIIGGADAVKLLQLVHNTPAKAGAGTAR